MSAAERAASMSPEELVAVVERGLRADESAARAASPGPWSIRKTPYAMDDELGIFSDDSEIVGSGYEGGGVWDRPTAEHIARHDPSRVLADVQAKRDLLAAAQELLHEHEAGPDPMARIALEALARPYLDQETP